MALCELLAVVSPRYVVAALVPKGFVAWLLVNVPNVTVMLFPKALLAALRVSEEVELFSTTFVTFAPIAELISVRRCRCRR